MKVIVVGGNGFIGKNLLPIFLNKNYEITATYKSTKPNIFKNKIKWVKFNYKKDSNLQIFKDINLVIHLGWENLPNYTKNFHTKVELKYQKKFIKNIIKLGTKNIFIAGTCFEYGKIEGLCKEITRLNPNTEYGKAKNELRIYVEKLNAKYNFKYTWGRMFYLYGKHQSTKSLYPQLMESIKKNKTFKMSIGEQLRDFLSIEEACKYIFLLSTNNKKNKIVNICSNNKIKVKKLINKIIKKNKSKIKILYGKYQIPPYEAKNFWGSNKKLHKLLK